MSEHRHVIYKPDGRKKYVWSEGSRMVIDDKLLTAADCEDPDCPYGGP